MTRVSFPPLTAFESPSIVIVARPEGVLGLFTMIVSLPTCPLMVRPVLLLKLIGAARRRRPGPSSSSDSGGARYPRHN